MLASVGFGTRFGETEPPGLELDVVGVVLGVTVVAVVVVVMG